MRRRAAGTVRSQPRANANRRLVETAKGSTSSFGASKPAPTPWPMEAERTTRRGRPIGTADLSADAATRNPAGWRAGRRTVEATPRRLEAKRWAPWAAAAAIVLIAGVVLALSLDSAGGRRTATTPSAPILATAAGLASLAGLGGAIRIKISTVDRELEAIDPSSN